MDSDFMKPYLLDFFWFTPLVRALSNSFVLDKSLAEGEGSADLDTTVDVDAIVVDDPGSDAAVDLDAVDLDAMMVGNKVWRYAVIVLEKIR